MGALHVVGIDLKLGLGVDLSLWRQKEVVVGLIRIGLLRWAMDMNFAGERSLGLPIQHALVILIAHAVGCQMIDLQDIVQMLACPGEIEAVELCFDLRTVKAGGNLVPDKAAT